MFKYVLNIIRTYFFVIFYLINLIVKKMIVICMTSWTKRINNVKPVVENFMRGTLQPDRLYLSLSVEEFPKKELDLPKDLVEYFNTNENLILNWVEGKNTKTMKKVFPVLQYLEDDDIILPVDDDIMYPLDYVEKRVMEYKSHLQPISGISNKNIDYIYRKNKMLGNWGAGCLFTKKMVNHWEKYVDEKILNSYNDDTCYAILEWLNGFIPQECKYYDIRKISNTCKYSEIDPSNKLNMYLKEEKLLNLHIKRINEITGKDYKNAFNFYKKKQKHDCVIVYGKNGVDSKEMTCGDHLEIEYVIASLKKYCLSWVGRIFVVGSEPPEEIKDFVIHVPCDDMYTHCKDANIIHKMRYACENIFDLTDDFLMVSDDQIVTKVSSWEDMKPRIVVKFDDWSIDRWNKWIEDKSDVWFKYLYNTLKLFPKDKSCFWEPHIWSPMNKYKFLEMCDKYDYEHKTDCIIFSLYYNFIEQDVVRPFDTHYIGNSNKDVIKWINDNKNSLKNIPRHLAWTDAAFSEKRFRDILDKIVGINENISDSIKPTVDGKSTDSRMNMLKKIRDGIKNGTIIKEYQPDGTYIWRKVRK